MERIKITLTKTILLVSLTMLVSATSWARDLPPTQEDLVIALSSEIFMISQPNAADNAHLLTQMGISPKGGWDLTAPVTSEILSEIYQLLSGIFPDSISAVTKTMVLAALRAGISFPEATTIIITSGVRWTPDDIASMKGVVQSGTNHHDGLETQLSSIRKGIEKRGISAQQRHFPFTMADFRNELLESTKIKEAIGDISGISDEFIAGILGDLISEGVKQAQRPPGQRPPQPPPTDIASPSQP